MGVSEGTASKGSSSREIDMKYDNRNFRQKKRAIERNGFPSLGDQASSTTLKSLRRNTQSPAEAAHKVAYVAGAGFFAGNTGEGRNCMRISYGNVTPEQIDLGMQRLGALIRAKLA